MRGCLQLSLLAKLLCGAVPVLAVMVGADFLWPPEVALIWRQVMLFAVGVGGILVAERFVFGPGWLRVFSTLGFVRPHVRAIVVALAVSIPIWLFLPLFGLFSGAPVGLRTGWLMILIGIVLVNGIAEEIIHRAFIFGHLQREMRFAPAATVSAVIFAAQHLYLPFTVGLVPGAASIVLAALLAFPLAFLFAHGGRSIAAPAILHTSANAPMMLLVAPETAQAVILPYMGVVLLSVYSSFAFTKLLKKSR
jgi:membrane protease YdiL (CAAX protease family)